MPGPARPLTDRQCSLAKYAEGSKTRLFDGHGLYLELTPHGTKYWRHKYKRPDGRENRLSYGPYPEVGLAEAREKRDTNRALLREGNRLKRSKQRYGGEKGDERPVETHTCHFLLQPCVQAWLRYIKGPEHNARS